jgi:fucose permease
LNFALAVHYAAMICMAVGVNFIPVFLTTLQNDLGGLSLAQMGRIGGTTFMGLVAGIILTSPLADRFGARLFAMAGNALIAAGLLAVGMCGSYDGLLVAVFLMGLGSGVLDMILSPLVAALRPHDRTGAMNRLHSFYCVGAVAVVFAGAMVIQMGIGWRALAMAIIPLPLAVTVIFAWLPLAPLVPEDEKRTGLKILLRSPLFLAAMVAIFLAGALETGLAQWLPAYAQLTLGYSKWTSGAALMAFYIAMTIGRMGIGSLGGRFSGKSVMLIGCASSIVIVSIASLAPWPGLALAACIVAGFSICAFWPSILALAADRFPHGGATLFGLLAALGSSGGIVMPWEIGKVADHSSMRVAMFTTALCPLLIAICLLGMRKNTRANS